MSGRATSLVVLTGFFTLSAGLLVAQEPRKAIKTASDLPAFSYPVRGTNAEVFSSEEAFRPIAEKLRADIDSLLRDYTIEDRSTLRGLHGTLLTLDLLQDRTAEARKEIALVRDLEDKPAAKQMSGLLEEALLDSGGTKTDRQEFFRRYSSALNRLPWDVVGDAVKEWKRRFETINESPAAPVETNSPAVRQTRLVDLATALRLADRRFGLVFARSVKREAVEALAIYIAAHNAPKADIWVARSVTLDAGAKAKPVVIGIWDTGVDRSLFRGQVATDGPVPGFDDEGNPTNGELLAFDATQRQRWPETRRLLKGFLDDQNLVDTPDASAYRKYLSTLKLEERRANRESMAFAGRYIHGTHVAGIALEGNPFGRLVVVRVASSHRVPPSPPTLAGARKFAAGTAGLTAYLRKQRARVVNMSFTETLARIEQKLQAAGAGADAAGRRKLAQEIFAVARDGMRKALASTPEILYVAAAGNWNANSTFDEDIWASIKDLPNLLIVGAVDQAGNEASFTSFGPAVTLYAKGLDVESYIPGGERMKGSGTSAAAPNVTNLAAKLIALDSSLMPADVAKLIRDGSDLSPDGRFRLINPKRSVELLQVRTR